MTEASAHGNYDSVSTPERQERMKIERIGALKDLGLGNPNGIRSSLESPEQFNEFEQKLAKCFSPITDEHHLGCIDGRCVSCNADGSKPEVRARQVGGTGLVIEVALNGEADIAELAPNENITEVINTVEGFLEKTLSIQRSAHLGGCGGVNGAIDDNIAIADKPAIMKVTEAIMEHPRVKELTHIAYSSALEERVKQNAGSTALWLKDNGWSGEAYVEGVKREEPQGVEELETNEDAFHGHKEKAVVIIVSENQSFDEQKAKEVGLGDIFVVTVKTSADIARAFAGQRGQEGEEQLLMANIAKHVAVADRLPHEDTNVYIATT